MRNSIAFILASSMLFIATGRGWAQQSLPASSVVTSEQKQVRLFNGKNLDGWYTFIKDRGRNKDPKSVFQVKQGILCISGEEWGCITTEKNFENYKLVAEYKWGIKTYGTRATSARDNGLLFHSIGEDGGYDGTWMYSIECNIIEGGTGDLLVVGDKTNRFLITCPVASRQQEGSYVFQPDGDPVNINFGRVNWLNRDPDWKDEKGFRGKNDMEKSVGEWNLLECVANGDQISIFLNGTLVNRAIYVRPSKGRIQIQSEGAEIFFRRVDLIPLAPVTDHIKE